MKSIVIVLSLLLALLFLPSCKENKSTIKDSCVRILNCKIVDGKCRIRSVGSGFIVNNNGDVVTNNHVSIGADKLFLIHKYQGKIKLYSAKLIKGDGDRDLAVLSSSVNGPALVLNLFEPENRAEVGSCGYPAVSDAKNIFTDPTLRTLVETRENDPDLGKRGLDITEAMKADVLVENFAEPSEYSGKVSRSDGKQPFQLLDEEGEPRWTITPKLEDGKILVNQEGKIIAQKLPVQGRPIKIIEHDVKVGHGNSGGPLVDKLNYLIGVVGDGQSLGSDSATFAISGTKELKPFLDEVNVRINTVSVDASAAGLGTLQKALITLAAAALIVGLALMIYLTRRSKTGPSSIPTTLIRQRIEQFMNGGKPPAGHQDAGQAPPLPQASGVAWELDVSGKDGHRQQINLTEADFTKGRGRVIVGRSVDFCGVTIRHDSVSRQQFHFTLKNGSLYVADRNSSNGTKVNGSRLEAPFREQLLKEGDRVEFGSLGATVHRRF